MKVLFFLVGIPAAVFSNGVTGIRFEEIGQKAGLRYTHHTRVFSGKSADVLRMFTSGGSAVAVGDYDNDGSLEAAFSRLNDTCVFFRRKSGPVANWLVLSLRGTRSNRDAIGARVQLILPSGMRIHDHVSTANGIYSASDKRIHVGLGDASVVRSLLITWPSGMVQKLEDVKVNGVLQITEPETPKSEGRR